LRAADAYGAADLVVVGKAPEAPGNNSPQMFDVRRVIKGRAKAREPIALTGPHCMGTACSGLAVLSNREFLLLLRRLPEGTYLSVDGNGNDACPSVFEVIDGQAKIGTATVPLGSLKSFLESRPHPIPYE
jgi:hypothetical protein